MFAPLAVMTLGISVLGARAHVPDDQIAPGVHVADLDLSNKPVNEARAALQTWAKTQQSVPVVMAFPEESRVKRTWTQEAYKIGLTVDVSATLEAASKAGREGLVGQVGQMLTGAKIVTIAPTPAVNREQLRGYLRQIAVLVNRKGVNARLLLTKYGGFGYKHDRPGLAMDIDASTDRVANAWTKRFAEVPIASSPDAAPKPTPVRDDSDVQHTKPENGGGKEEAAKTAPSADKPANSTANTPEALDVTLIANVSPAAITFDDLKRIDGEIGVYSTYVRGTDNRLNNVAIAARHINGKLLKPGEIFSYNNTVGQRSADNGFRKAHQIVHGRLVDAVGGGICQVSSTLFNAVLRSGLKIVERANHAFPIGYVPDGRDATVDWGNIDFRFQNNTDAPLYIAGGYHSHRLTFHILGKRTPGQEIKMVKVSESRGDMGTVTEADPSLPAGRRYVKERGHPRLSVTWVRIIKANGQEVQRDTIHSYYKSIPTIVTVGTRRAVHAAPKPTVKAPPPVVAPAQAAPPAVAPPNG